MSFREENIVQTLSDGVFFTCAHSASPFKIEAAEGEFPSDDVTTLALTETDFSSVASKICSIKETVKKPVNSVSVHPQKHSQW